MLRFHFSEIRMRLEIVAVSGLPEIRPGDDLAAFIGDVQPSDIVAIAQKIVSKSEGAIVDLRTIRPSADRKSVV